MSRKTLYRRLTELVARKELRIRGEGRGRRYLPKSSEDARSAQPIAAGFAEPYIPISDEGREIRAYIRRQEAGRKPVGYDAQWLEGYKPNQTYYLPESLRFQLAELGRSPSAEMPAGMVIKEAAAPPDPFRLRYRTALYEVVRDIVRKQQTPSEDVVRLMAGSHVPDSEFEHFQQLVLQELKHLHEGNISRYGLRLSEYETWVGSAGLHRPTRKP